MSKLAKRHELKREETWDLSLLYKSQADYEIALTKFKEEVKDFQTNYQGQLNQVEIIIKSLNDLETIFQRLSYLGSYASLGYEVDKFDEDYEKNAIKLVGLYEMVGENLSFYESELALLDEELLQEVGQANRQEYYHYIQELIRKKETFLSPENEKLLSSIDGSLNNHGEIYDSMKFQDMKFDDFEANGKVYSNSFAGFEGDYEGHPDLEVRHAAWKSFHDGLGRFQNTAASNYINHVQTQKKIAKLRGFDSVFDYLLFDQKVTTESYNLIIDTLMEEFAPVMRRYSQQLKQEHGLDSISLADIKMPFSTGQAAHISIEESRKMIEDAFAILGEDYLAIVRRAFDERWIDYPMNESKSTGGFCATVMDGPSYILLNWTGLLSEVLVLAHELGHAGHFQLTYDNQNLLTPEASLYFVEAPSTANEVIMCQYLLNRPIEDEAKRTLIAEFVARTYYHNMVTHLLEADFQRKVYLAVDRDEVLNTRSLNKLYHETLSDFWSDALEINPGAELTWMRQPHYFMGLYSYTYSAGLTVGTQIGQRIAAGEEEAIHDWLEVLKAGGSKGPVELANQAGVDMRDATALRSAIQYVDALLDQLDKLQ